MNPILEWGINLIVAVQTAAPWLKTPALALSFLGNEEFFLLALPFVYWCVDVPLGIRVAAILTLSNGINTLFKLSFHQPRPYWLSTQVTPGVQEMSYGLPSGHAQNAATIWGTLGRAASGWLRWLLVALIFLIGLSRIVVGVHFPTDVLVGWLIGGAIWWAFVRWEKPALAWFKRMALAQQIGLALVASLVLLAVSISGLALVPPADPAEWEANAARFFPPEAGETATNPRDVGGLVGNVGTLFGLAAGVILLLHQGGYDPRVAWWKRGVRFAIGLIGVLILWMGLRLVFPRDASFVSQVLRFARYGVTGFWVAYGAPWVFAKFKM